MQVFISHAKQDASLAKRLRKALAQESIPAWSSDEIYPGDNWAKETGEALDNSDIMLALVTPNSLESGPLGDDVPFALTSRNYRGRVIPVLVGMSTFDTSKDVPWILLRLKPVCIESANSDLGEVVERVRAFAELTQHATS